jgi:hypothetical protein
MQAERSDNTIESNEDQSGPAEIEELSSSSTTVVKRWWFVRWFRRDPDEKVVPRADLSDGTSFYFDEKLGKWVNKNATVCLRD